MAEGFSILLCRRCFFLRYPFSQVEVSVTFLLLKMFSPINSTLQRSPAPFFLCRLKFLGLSFFLRLTLRRTLLGRV